MEYPEVFFNQDGEKKVGNGFDAVVGNPPYARIQLLPDSTTSYFTREYQSTSGSYDLYVVFVEKGVDMLNNKGEFGYIIPNKVFQVDYGAGLREYLSRNRKVAGVVDFGSNQVFPEAATTYTTILRLQGSRREKPFEYWELDDGERPESVSEKSNFEGWERIECTNESLSDGAWNFLSEKVDRVVESAGTVAIDLEELVEEISRGVSSGLDDVFEVRIEKQGDGVTRCSSSAESGSFEIETSALRTPIHSTDFGKYSFEESENIGLIWPYDSDYELLPPSEFTDRYPNTWQYLSKNRDALENRSDYSTWYGYSAPRSLRVHDNGEILIPLLADSPSFTRYPEPQSDYALMASGGFSISLPSTSEYSEEYILSLINSKLLFLHLRSYSNVFRGGYVTCTKQYFKQLPIREIEFNVSEPTRHETVQETIREYKSDLEQQLSDATNAIVETAKTHIEKGELGIAHDLLAELVDEIISWKKTQSRYNLSLLDYIGRNQEGVDLSQIGLNQPAQEVSKSLLQETTEQKPNLRIGDAAVSRKSPNTVLIEATARYKPDDEDAHDTDQWGYAETEYLPAFRITNLTETEADLIEHFVPVAVDEADGFAEFRETATTTNSLIDRLKAIELPDVDYVADDLDNYLRTKERAVELDEKIEKTDQLIDEIVYDLYGLSEEEITIIEEAVGHD